MLIRKKNWNMNKVSTIMTWIDVKIINKKSNLSVYPSPPKKKKEKPD